MKRTMTDRQNDYITLGELMKAFFGQNPRDWRYQAEIITDSMPQFPVEDTKPIMAVKYGEAYLRYSAGPHQGFFWDDYPDDLMTFGLAFKALLEAPTPPSLWMKNDSDYVDEIISDRNEEPDA